MAGSLTHRTGPTGRLTPFILAAVLVVAALGPPATVRAGAGLSLGPGAAVFGSYTVGVRAPTQGFNVSNGTAAPVTVNSVTSSRPMFLVLSDGCSGVTIPVGQGCQFQLAFQPQSAVALSAVVTVTTTAGAVTATAYGTGVLAPPIAQYGNQAPAPAGPAHSARSGGGCCGPQYAMPSGVASAGGLIWFSEGGMVGSIQPGQTSATDHALNAGNQAYGLAAGAGPQSGNLWIAEDTRLGRIPLAGGTVTDYSIPATGGMTGARAGIVVDTAGRVWATLQDANQIAELDPAGAGGSGTWTTFNVPSAGSDPMGLARDAGGNLWFTESVAGRIGELTPGTATFHEFVIPGTGAAPTGITIDSGGRIWFSSAGRNSVEQMTAAGAFQHEYGLPTSTSGPQGIAVGPSVTGYVDIWAVESQAAKVVHLNVNLSNFSTTNREFTVPPSCCGRPFSVVAGPDGNIWFAPGAFSGSNTIDRLGLTGPAASDAPVATTNVSTVDFGNQVIGRTSAAEPIAISDAGNIYLQVGSIVMTGTNPSAFTLVANCAGDAVAPPAGAPPARVQPLGGTPGLYAPTACIFRVVFRPPALGSYSATANIYTDASASPVAVTLSGAGRAPGTWSEYPLPSSGAGPDQMAVDGAGNIWFLEALQNQIGEVTPGPTPAFHEYPIVADGSPGPCAGPDPTAPPNTAGCMLQGITLGGDGNIWVGLQGMGANGGVARVTGAGAVTTFAGCCGTTAITTGPGGHLFLFSGGQVEEMNTSGGIVNQWFLSNLNNYVPTSMASGGDGAIWLTLVRQSCCGGAGPDLIGRLDLTNGAFTTYNIPTVGGGATSLVVGAAGNLWFTEPAAGRIGHVTIAGPVIADNPVPTAHSVPESIVRGSDGNLWFTEWGMNRLGRISPSWPGCSGCYDDFTVPVGNSQPFGITASGSSIWFTGFGSSLIGSGPVAQPANT